jgi:hypothetical protein
MMMIRVIAIVGGGLALAACSSNSEWLNLDALKPGPTMETVRFESEPPGAEVKVSTGQTCRTPCALAVQQPDKGNLNAAFTLTGYEGATEEIQLVSQGDGTSKLRPNPVTVQMTAAPPPPKKKPVRKKKTASKPTPKPAPKPAAAAAPPPATPAPAAQQQAPSPWPPVQAPPKQ